DAAGVEPPRPFAPEDRPPVDVARLELRDGGVAAVRAAQRGAQAEAALGEVQAVAHSAPDAIIFHPADVRLIDAALVDQVLNQSPYGIVRQRRDDGRVHPEAALEAARDVVLAAALPDLERARGVDASAAGVEPQQHLAEAHHVPTAL